MAEYTPPIEASLEEVDLLRWLIEHVKDLAADWDRWRPLFETILKANATAASESNRINNRVEEIAGFVSTTRGLPDGAQPGYVVGADVKSRPVWLPKDEWPLIVIDLIPGAPTWHAYSYSDTDWQNAFPPPLFTEADGVLHVDLIPFWESSSVNMRADYVFILRPTVEGQRFDIGLPMEAYGTSPDFSFTIKGDPTGTYESIVSIGTRYASKAHLFYAGTTARFMGWVDSGAYEVFPVPPDFVGVWTVQVRGQGYTLFPVTRHQADGTTAILDPYYRANVLVPTGTDLAELIRDTIAAALVAGSGISITVNDTDNTILITNTGGGGPTSGYGAGVYGGLPTYGG